MNTMQQQVQEFHRAMAQPIGHYPRIQDASLRASLMLEETIETAIALLHDLHDDRDTAFVYVREKIEAIMEKERDRTPEGDPLEQVIDGVCDTLYVTFGTAVACGFDAQPFFDEVHRANMAKAAGTVRMDGKREKPVGWKGPQLAPLIEQHEPTYLAATMTVAELLRQRDRLLEQVAELQHAANRQLYAERKARGSDVSGMEEYA